MENQIRVIVGIDFGTTYSAICWADSKHPDQAEVLHNYPSSGVLVGSQVPSEVAYDDGDTSQFSWGYDISLRARKVKWFKLGLEADHPVMHLPSGMDAQDVVRDFLSKLYSHVISTLYRRFDRSVMAVTKIDFVLTYPAIWTEKSRRRLEQAARQAGFGNEHQLKLFSEPEAAAVYSFVHNNSSEVRIKVGDRIVVCDCGGGTADLISYDVLQSDPSLSVTECTAGTGDYCGSTFIDRNFEQLFSKRMGAHLTKLSIVSRQQVVKNFESAKIAFRDDPDRKFYVNVPTIADLEEAGIIGGGFELTREDMRGLFDPVISRIKELIQEQVIASSKGSHRVNSILLVGGFGESEYLFKRVEEWSKQYNIQVIQPREASTAIVRGAVIKGLASTQSQVQSHKIIRKARRSYGVIYNMSYIEHKHLAEDAYIDRYTGKKMASNQVNWFLTKNQTVNDDEGFRHHFGRDFRKLAPWKDTLVVCDLDQPPSRFEPGAVKKFCVIDSDLTHIRRSKFKRKWNRFIPYRTAQYELVLNLRDGNMTFHLDFMGQTYGVKEIAFE